MAQQKFSHRTDSTNMHKGWLVVLVSPCWKIVPLSHHHYFVDIESSAISEQSSRQIIHRVIYLTFSKAKIQPLRSPSCLCKINPSSACVFTFKKQHCPSQ